MTTAQDIADALDTQTEVLCAGCQRPLREPASRALRLGPVCRQGLRDLARPPAPGQDVIPGLNLPDHHDPKDDRP